MIEKELENEIDKLIKYVIDNNVIVFNVAKNEKERKAFAYLKANGFFEKAKSKNQYNPSESAYKLYELGAKKYFKKQKDNETVEGKIKRKTLFDLSNKYFINFALVIFSAYLGWLSKSFYLEKGEKDTIEKQNKLISEKNDSIILTQTLLNEKRTLILSLKKEIDSLKIKKSE